MCDVRLLVGYAPGGVADFYARLPAQCCAGAWCRRSFNQQQTPSRQTMR